MAFPRTHILHPDQGVKRRLLAALTDFFVEQTFLRRKKEVEEHGGKNESEIDDGITVCEVGEESLLGTATMWRQFMKMSLSAFSRNGAAASPNAPVIHYQGFLRRFPGNRPDGHGAGPELGALRRAVGEGADIHVLPSPSALALRRAIEATLGADTHREPKADYRSASASRGLRCDVSLLWDTKGEVHRTVAEVEVLKDWAAAGTHSPRLLLVDGSVCLPSGRSGDTPCVDEAVREVQTRGLARTVVYVSNTTISPTYPLSSVSPAPTTVVDAESDPDCWLPYKNIAFAPGLTVLQV
jgi:hypothetical protein